jgi:hypothetical protein
MGPTGGRREVTDRSWKDGWNRKVSDSPSAGLIQFLLGGWPAVGESTSSLSIPSFLASLSVTPSLHPLGFMKLVILVTSWPTNFMKSEDGGSLPTVVTPPYPLSSCWISRKLDYYDLLFPNFQKSQLERGDMGSDVLSSGSTKLVLILCSSWIQKEVHPPHPHAKISSILA